MAFFEYPSQAQVKDSLIYVVGGGGGGGWRSSTGRRTR